MPISLSNNVLVGLITWVGREAELEVLTPPLTSNLTTWGDPLSLGLSFLVEIGVRLGSFMVDF